MELNNNGYITERGRRYSLGMSVEWIFPKEILAASEVLQDWSRGRLEQGLVVRPLGRKDWDNGYGELLSQLTTVGKVTSEEFTFLFDEMSLKGRELVVVVVSDDGKGKIVGSATLALEQKLIHSAAMRGRIEDVVVSEEFRGKGLGRMLVEVLTDLAKVHKCYKVTLDCKDALLDFYHKLGYTKEKGQNSLVLRFHE